MLTKTEIRLLKELAAAGQCGRTLAGTSRSEIAYLMRAQYIKRLPAVKLYVITRQGQQVLAEVTAGHE